MTRIPVNPELLTWARERAGLDMLALAGRFPKLSDWEAGELQPTLRQLEDFARAVHVAVGLLFLPAPPDEPLPIPDFRTVGDHELKRPSPNLLDTIYLCQQRQDWFRDYARVHALPALDFAGSATLQHAPERVAEAMRQTLALSIAERQQSPTWTDALRQLIGKAEDAGVLVMASGVIGSNSHRKLSVEEFRGFALADELAPLAVFVNKVGRFSWSENSFFGPLPVVLLAGRLWRSCAPGPGGLQSIGIGCCRRHRGGSRQQRRAIKYTRSRVNTTIHKEACKSSYTSCCV